MTHLVHNRHLASSGMELIAIIQIIVSMLTPITATTITSSAIAENVRFPG